MDKEEILQKSRKENAAGYMDERERELHLREDSVSLGFGLLLALVTGMSAAGFIFRCIKDRKKSNIFWASLCTLLMLFYLYRFFVGAI